VYHHDAELLELSPKINSTRLQLLGKILTPEFQILYADQHDVYNRMRRRELQSGFGTSTSRNQPMQFAEEPTPEPKTFQTPPTFCNCL
jgi:hypothetical protein